MPIRPEDRSKYGPGWARLSREVREAAGQRCDCRGECGDDHAGNTCQVGARCQAPNGATIIRHRAKPQFWLLLTTAIGETGTGGTLDDSMLGEWSPRPIRVVLTVAHLDHDAANHDRDNLRAMCQRCHLRLDRHQHARNAAATRARKVGQGSLFGGAA